ncbi:2-hydroxycarboxylate transporter family protein [Arthrobacter sp. D1-17]
MATKLASESQGATETPTPERKRLEILGIPWPWYLLLVGLCLAAIFTETLPDNVFMALAATMLLGCGLFFAGERTRGLSAVGGGPLLCIFVPALVAHFGLLPASFLEIVKDWFTGYGFVEVIIAAIITGSILGMDRRFLIKAGGRFVIVMLAAIVIVVGVVGAVAALTGFGFKNAALNIALPVMAGGISGGAIPLSQMYADTLGGDPQQYMSILVPPIVFANLLCILIAAIYAALTRRGTQLFVGFNGNGDMVRVTTTKAKVDAVTKKGALTLSTLGAGLLVTGGIYMASAMVETLVPDVHLYAWLILFTVGLKLTGVLPAHVEESATNWYEAVTKLWIPAALVAIGLGLISINQMLELFARPDYLFFTVAAVVVAALAAGGVGWLLRLNFIESSITGGLCSADMGGSGDIATLGTSGRMHLMPFAQIASRLGGGVVLLLASLLLAIL